MDYEKDVIRQDFPIARRGYDTAAVDSYLERLSERLKEAASRDEVPVASSVSEQVAAIVGAAEKTAAEMHRKAEEDTSRMLAQAAADSRAHVQRVEDSSKTLLSELSSLRERAQKLMEDLESSSSQLSDGLHNLREDVSTFRGEAAEDAKPTSSGEKPRKAIVISDYEGGEVPEEVLAASEGDDAQEAEESRA